MPFIVIQRKSLRRRNRTALCTILFLAAFLVSYHDAGLLALLNSTDQQVGGRHSPEHMFHGLKPMDFRQAHNSTLGFGSIQVINMPHRFDRYDSITMQAEVTGLDIIFSDGVYGNNIKKSILPPTSNLNENEIACIRAHAKTWRKMIRNGLETSLVMESDADWETTIKQSMALIMQNLPRILQGDHWDVLQFGVCQELPNSSKKDHIAFEDPYVPNYSRLDSSQQHIISEYFQYDRGSGDSDIHFPRIIQRSNGTICTTAYAVSRRGAMKLLHQVSRFLDDAVDVIMQRMSSQGLLEMYTIVPPLVGQWKYIDDNVSNSDIGRHSWQDREVSSSEAASENDMHVMSYEAATPTRSVKYTTFNQTWIAPPNIARSSLQAVADRLWPTHRET